MALPERLKSLNPRPDTWQKKDDIQEMCIDDPYLSLKDIGDILGISRERVRQIIDKNNYYATTEGFEYLDLIPITRLRKPSIKSTYICIDCGKEGENKRKYGRCSDCLAYSHRLRIVCAHCNKEVLLTGPQTSSRKSSRNRGKIKNPERYFCSQHCSSVYMGKANRKY